ncbi:hypothetical protein [Paenibacillus hexagrammi]|uniref:Uncharacterized protein n=1 Tax=Paenibacillus hexagrammi TaxID=2908839 RepID=A0ABY3SH24_9BACL|nr:hypothetical protein [Paenibacillus sp. YPD9-1]UJF33338.1 hypothetical protein L0M14_28135 [Paenibacillus sp. YPD9-1]
MEKSLTATFTNVENLEQAADELRQQGVLDLKFDNNASFKIDFQAHSLVQSTQDIVSDHAYTLEVTVEKSRYRQAEDTLVKHGGHVAATY